MKSEIKEVLEKVPVSKFINYRGVRQANLIKVCEGDGNKVPFELVDYVIARTSEGIFETIGKVVPLTPEERSFIGVIIDHV